MPYESFNSIENERAVLGAILINPREACPEVLPILGEDGAMFHEQQFGAIYEAVLQVLGSGRPLDVNTLGDELKQLGRLDAVGGMLGLTELADEVPTSSNVAHYAGIVRRYYHLRFLHGLCADGLAAAKRPDADPYEIAEAMERRVFSVTESRAARHARPIGVVADIVVQQIRRDWERGGLPGLETGIRSIDQVLSGLKPAEVVILAARPSEGKTALALNIAHHVALNLRRTVMVVSLEMPAESVTRRLLCIDGQISGEELLSSGDREPAVLARLDTSLRRLREATIVIEDSRDTTSAQVRACVRHHAMRQDLDLVIVDYCQELRAAGNWVSNRTEEVGQICRDMRAMAQEVDAPVLLLSQLNREAAGEEPQLHQLRSSGDLEQSADVVLILFRDRGKADRVHLKVAKNRNGPTGACVLHFDRRTGRFDDCDSDDEPMARHAAIQREGPRDLAEEMQL